MKNLPIVRLFVSVFSLVAVTSALGFTVDAKTGNFPAMAIVMVVSMVIGMIPIQRWWMGVNRAMGVPIAKPSLDQLVIGLVVLISLVAAVVAELFTYASTHNRLAEASVAICTIVPIGFFILPESYRRMRAITAKEVQLSRFSYYAQIGMVVIFGLNLCLQLTERHFDQSLSVLHEWVIAGYFTVLAFSPFTITLLRRRYLEAKALSDATPPASVAGA